MAMIRRKWALGSYEVSRAIGNGRLASLRWMVKAWWMAPYLEALLVLSQQPSPQLQVSEQYAQEQAQRAWMQ